MEMETNQEKLSLLPGEKVAVHSLVYTLESPRQLTTMSQTFWLVWYALGFVCFVLFCFSREKDNVSWGRVRWRRRERI